MSDRTTYSTWLQILAAPTTIVNIKASDKSRKMILNLLANEQNLDLKSSDSVNIEKAICKFSFALAAVYLVCFQTFLSESYPPKSTLVSGSFPAAARLLGESLGLKTRPSNSTFEISNIQTSIKYSIAQEICIDQDGNEYHCP